MLKREICPKCNRRSKGCGNKERLCANCKINRPHFLSIQTVWYNMLDRCLNYKNKRYYRYGGRGIAIFIGWFNLENFYDWVINNGYEPGLQIDRINNDGDYTPKNCRFITPKENSNNTSRNRFIEYNQQKLTVAQLADKLNIPDSALRGILKRNNYIITDKLLTDYSEMKHVREQRQQLKVLV